MNTHCHEFFNRIKTAFPSLIKVGNVLEHGSYNINGTARDHFKHDSWIGIDWRAGPCVDHVGFMHEFKTDITFDLAISVGTLEHDPHWKESVQHLIELLKPGGSLIVLAAGLKTIEHHPECGPDEYYKNLSLHDLVSWTTSLTYFKQWLLEDEEDIILGSRPGSQNDIRLVGFSKI